MLQEYISDEEWRQLSDSEKRSLQAIRSHFKNNLMAIGDEDRTLQLVDRAYEALGARFRNRINSETKAYGRYEGDLEGVFLVICHAIGCYECAEFFPAKATIAAAQYKEYIQKHRNCIEMAHDAINKLKYVVDWLTETSILTYETDCLNKTSADIEILNANLMKHFENASIKEKIPSRAEFFVLSVCGDLLWHANIKITKPLQSSGDKSPLLRFIEVFFLLEGYSALSSIYEKQKRMPALDKIGGRFYPVNRE
ncbi:hypothetical protein NMD15_07015 [Plesiomonas shigelloides]|uniref:hypothetical protein n=1 Tax=Plesiomonas shigelloides TaxID=703 RepID=UPI00351CC9D4